MIELAANGQKFDRSEITIGCKRAYLKGAGQSRYLQSHFNAVELVRSVREHDLRYDRVRVAIDDPVRDILSGFALRQRAGDDYFVNAASGENTFIFCCSHCGDGWKHSPR